MHTACSRTVVPCTLQIRIIELKFVVPNRIPDVILHIKFQLNWMNGSKVTADQKFDFFKNSSFKGPLNYKDQ